LQYHLGSKSSHYLQFSPLTSISGQLTTGKEAKKRGEKRGKREKKRKKFVMELIDLSGEISIMIDCFPRWSSNLGPATAKEKRGGKKKKKNIFQMHPVLNTSWLICGVLGAKRASRGGGGGKVFHL